MLNKLLTALFGEVEYYATNILDEPVRTHNSQGIFVLNYQTVHRVRIKYGIQWSRTRVRRGWVFEKVPARYDKFLANISDRWFDTSTAEGSINMLMDMASNIREMPQIDTHQYEERHCS